MPRPPAVAAAAPVRQDRGAESRGGRRAVAGALLGALLSAQPAAAAQEAAQVATADPAAALTACRAAFRAGPDGADAVFAEIGFRRAKDAAAALTAAWQASGDARNAALPPEKRSGPDAVYVQRQLRGVAQGRIRVYLGASDAVLEVDAVPAPMRGDMSYRDKCALYAATGAPAGTDAAAAEAVANAVLPGKTLCETFPAAAPGMVSLWCFSPSQTVPGEEDDVSIDAVPQTRDPDSGAVLGPRTVHSLSTPAPRLP